MLKTLRLHNFKSFLNSELSFTQRHLIIGRNNSGKTSLCTALQFLRRTATDDLPTSVQFVPGGLGELTNWVLNSNLLDLSIDCELPYQGKDYLYTYDLSLKVEPQHIHAQNGHAALSVVSERLCVTGLKGETATLLESDGREAYMLHEESQDEYQAKTLAPRDATMLSKLFELETNRLAINFRNYLSMWLFYSPSPAAMRIGWRDAATASRTLSTLGDNLAAVLFAIKNMDEQRYRRVLDHVRLVEPNLQAVNFIPVPDQGAVPFIDLKYHSRASWQGLSDGTLRCLALAVIAETAAGEVSNPDLASVPFVVIEEPENGIYPGQLRAFFDIFEERAPSAQFLFTSHSPYFINLFDGIRSSVTFLRRRKERTEVVKIPPPEDDPDRPLLAEQYSMELLD